MRHIVFISAMVVVVNAGTVFGRGFGGFHGGGFGGAFSGAGSGAFSGAFSDAFGGGGIPRGDLGAYRGAFGIGGRERGFGGGYRGGFGEGGFGGGGGFGRPQGGFGENRAGLSREFSQLGFGTGGFRPGEFGPMRGQGSFGEAGRYRSQEAPSAGRLNSFLGLPTDTGMHAASGFEHAAGYSGSARGIAAANVSAGGERDASGREWTGPNGTTITHGSVGERGAVVGPNGAAAGEHGARGTVVEGPNGTTVAHGEAGSRGAAVGKNGAVAGSRGVSGAAVRKANGNVAGRASEVTRNWSSADLRVQGNNVRRNFNDYGAFNHDWYRRHSGTWWTNSYANGLWLAASWTALNNWFGQQWPPLSYDYGDNLTYVNNNVYMNDQPIATAADYYQSAATLAQTGEQAEIPSEQPSDEQVDPAKAKWLPLGVFEALREDEKTSTMMFQLAVNKEGIVRGNYFNTADKVTQPLEGAVDKLTQRISWVVADRKKIIFDTGLYNLTKSETPVLVHMNKDKTEQWLLVRLKQKSATSQEH